MVVIIVIIVIIYDVVWRYDDVTMVFIKRISEYEKRKIKTTDIAGSIGK